VTLEGISQPGERTETRAGLEHDYYLVKKQVGQAIQWGWAIIVLAMFAIFAFWASDDLRGWWAWMREEWKWLVGPFVLWAFVPLVFGIYKMLGMVSDSSWPAPRAAIPPGEPMPGPRWWWRRDWEYEDDEPVQAKRRIEIVLKSHNGRTVQYADLPDLPGLATFAKLVVGGESFAYRTANRCGISDGQFDDLASLFRSKRRPEWARWRNPDNKKLGTELLPAGEAVMERLAQDSPTLLEAV